MTRPESGADFDVLAIIGTRLEGDGSLHSPRHISRREAPSGKNSRKQAIYPVVSFRNGDAGRKMLHSESARRRAVQELRRLAGQSPYKGLHLDLEYLDGDEAPFLLQFLEELYPLLKQDHRKLSLSVFPENFPARYAAFHDLSRIQSFADEFVLMTYDLHRPSSLPGPVTDLHWAEEAIRLALNHVPGNRLWLGVPAYGYEWTLPSGRYRTLTASSFRRVLSEARSNQIQRTPSGCLFVSRSGPDGTRVLAFFPDQEMRRGMEELAVRFALRGTALWRPEFDKK